MYDTVPHPHPLNRDSYVIRDIYKISGSRCFIHEKGQLASGGASIDGNEPGRLTKTVDVGSANSKHGNAKYFHELFGKLLSRVLTVMWRRAGTVPPLRPNWRPELWPWQRQYRLEYPR